MTTNNENVNNQVNSSNGLNNEDILKTLERVNFWISNCDTKISFALAFAGVLLAGFFSSSIITGSLGKLIDKAFKIDMTAKLWEVRILDVTMLLLIAFTISVVVAVTYLFMGLKGSIDASVYKEHGLMTDSVIFFGTIANQTFQSFKNKVMTIEANQVHNDLLSQIFINSKICRRKFRLYNNGVNYLIVSIALFVLLNILFLFIN